MSEIDSALGVKKPPAVEYCMYFTFGTSETFMSNWGYLQFSLNPQPIFVCRGWVFLDFHAIRMDSTCC